MTLDIQKFLLIFILMCPCKLLVKPNELRGFSPALATWYGDPYGAGSGGACGWSDDVQSPPFSSMIAAGNANIYLRGKGCGNCYQILCTRVPYCSMIPVTMTITDECPGACNNVPFAFDLSGTAFGAMSSPGQADNLRNLGRVDVQYQRVPCNYGTTKIAFKTDQMVNPYWFSMAVEFCAGDGGLSSIEIAPFGSQQFRSMENIWGAVWAVHIDPSFHGPYTFRLTSPNNEPVIAVDAVPLGFVPGKSYYSLVNFRS
ncbi:expansin-B15-like [Bidens hawaiensis]|uniref:expansin-B15-like n=1 Tax=Bidens hawaiensis TaxID=980011 RepID=UPI00404A2AF5